MKKNKTDMETQPSTKSRRKKHVQPTKDIEIKVAELGKTDLTQKEIGEIVGLERSTVSKMLQRFNIERVDVDTFKNEKADAMAVIQREILKSVTPEEVKKAPIQTKMLTFGILYDKERLERGQANQITSIQSVSVDVQATIDELKGLKLGLSGIKQQSDDTGAE